MAVVSESACAGFSSKMLDEREFLSPYGIRALSRVHEAAPVRVRVQAATNTAWRTCRPNPTSAMFGGNSNWRGPIWMPMNVLLIRALLQFYLYYGDTFTIECPTGSGHTMNLFEVARRDRRAAHTRIFLRDEHGRRPVLRRTRRHSRHDPHWRDHLLFYEYFHGDNGAGLGASHQTGWTGLAATFIELFGNVTAAEFLEGGKMSLLGGAKETWTRQPA